MSEFVEVVAEWRKLMCVENTHATENRRIELIREDHVLNLTDRFINRLRAVQQNHDNTSSQFALRVKSRINNESDELSSLELVCNRFLAGIGMTFRREIPGTLSRSQRSKLRRLVVNWTSDSPNAYWEGTTYCFSLRKLLLLCSKHSAGADESLGHALVDQLLVDLRIGNVAIPRLTLESNVKDQTVLFWEKASISLDEGETTLPLRSSIEDENTSFIAYIEDCMRDFHYMIHHARKSDSSCVNTGLEVEVAYAVDEAEDPDDDDATQQRVFRFLDRAMLISRAKKEVIYRALASAAYSGIAEAIVSGRGHVIGQRINVLKLIRRHGDRVQVEKAKRKKMRLRIQEWKRRSHNNATGKGSPKNKSRKHFHAKAGFKTV